MARTQRLHYLDLGSCLAPAFVDVTHSPPVGWSRERRWEYFDWTEQVVAGCRGTNAPLEMLYDKVLGEGRAAS